MHAEVPYRFVLWGSAGHAKVLADLIALRGGRVVALFDNSPEAASCLSGVPVYVGRSGLQQWCAEQETLADVQAAMAIGGARGRDRLQIAQWFREEGLMLATLVHPTAMVSATARLGAGCQILAQAVVAADAVLGEACIVNHHANVDHECVLGDGVHMAPASVLCGCVTLCDNTMVGANAVVLPRLRVGMNAVVGAGSVVTHDVPDDSVVAGNPARLLGAKND